MFYQIVTVMLKERWMKFVTKILENVCAKKVLVVHVVINVYLVTITIQIVFPVIVPLLEEYQRFVMLPVNVHV